MSANLKLEENFLELVKDLFTSDAKVSRKHSDEIFNMFDDIVLKGQAFLMLTELISFSTSGFVISLKQN